MENQKQNADKDLVFISPFIITFFPFHRYMSSNAITFLRHEMKLPMTLSRL